jgi:hypothetical protein
MSNTSPDLQLVATFPSGSSLDDYDIPRAHRVRVDMIDSAKRSLDIGQFYTISAPRRRMEPVLAAIERAAERNVAVRTIVDSKFVKDYGDAAKRLEAVDGIELSVLDVDKLTGGMAAIFDAFSELQGIRQYQELIDLELLKMGAFVAAEMTPHLWASGVKMPVLMVQVLEDAWTRNPEDAQKTFDLLGSDDKELLWIEGATRRFKDGYNYFERHPEKILPFFQKHMQ